MAFAADPSSISGDGTNLSCPVCLDIYEQPIEITCGHSFCKDCIKRCLSKVPISQCPICRTSFTTVQMTDSIRLANKIKSSSKTCSKCNQMIKLSSFRKHKDRCTGKLGCDSSSKLKLMTPTMKKASSNLPNRSTFKCPYCAEKNLDRETLIDHVNMNHSQDRQQVVCPICASMPWGKSDQLSSDFHQHLSVRHKFDYDTFVDYNDDEDDILQAVLEKSKEEV